VRCSGKGRAAGHKDNSDPTGNGSGGLCRDGGKCGIIVLCRVAMGNSKLKEFLQQTDAQGHLSKQVHHNANNVDRQRAPTVLT